MTTATATRMKRTRADKRRIADEARDLTPALTPNLATGNHGIADEANVFAPVASNTHAGKGWNADEAKDAAPACVQLSPPGNIAPADEAISTAPGGVSPPSPRIASGFADDLQPKIHRLQRIIGDRMAIIKTQRRIKQAVLARINSRIGGANRELFGDEHKATREELWKQAELVYAAACGKKSKGLLPEYAPIVTEASALVLAYESALAPINQMRDDLEAEARELAVHMPGYEWWVAQDGLDALGVAIVVGNAGDVGSYRNRSCFLKRMSIAVIDGCRQGKPPEGASEEVWIHHGYKKQRRAAMYTIGVALFMRQTKTEGPWREVYDKRRKDRESREVYGPPDKAKGRYHNDAMRYMTVKLLQRYRSEWIAQAGTTRVADEARQDAPACAA